MKYVCFYLNIQTRSLRIYDKVYCTVNRKEFWNTWPNSNFISGDIRVFFCNAGYEILIITWVVFGYLRLFRCSRLIENWLFFVGNIGNFDVFFSSEGSRESFLSDSENVSERRGSFQRWDNSGFCCRSASSVEHRVYVAILGQETRWTATPSFMLSGRDQTKHRYLKQSGEQLPRVAHQY